MGDEPLLLDRVATSYGGRPILRDVSFRVRRGEAVGYLGPNGAGKTTTLKVLAGFTPVDAGTVRVAGVDPRHDRARALRSVGALLDTPGLVPYVTVGDLLEYVARVRGVPGAEAAEAAGRVGVGDQLARRMGDLSTGLARRALIAAALVGRPEVLLLDEPTLGLDPVARRDLRATLRGLVGEGVTLLLSTHLLDDVEEVCDRVLFLRTGRLVGDEPVPRAGALATRTLRLSFAAVIDGDRLAAALPPSASVEEVEGRSVRLRLDGGDDGQVAAVRAVVGAGLPLLDATTSDRALERRYLEVVGREDAT